MTSATTASIKIGASAADIIKVLLDFNNYANWSGLTDVSMISSSDDGLEYVVAFKISSSGIQDKVTIKVLRVDSTEITWELVESALLTELAGHFMLNQEEVGCLVSYDLELRFKNPFFNAMKKNAETQLVSKILSRLLARMAEL
jgi:ribosome-associated toxin RatA of RatAB toxin-antitoxin module